MTELACYRKAFIIVALYDTLGEEAIEYIVNQTEMKYIVATADKVQRLLGLKHILPSIEYIIVMDEDYDKSKDSTAASEAKIEIHTFAEVEKIGEGIAEQDDLPSPDDIATICYTRYLLGNCCKFCYGNLLTDFHTPTVAQLVLPRALFSPKLNPLPSFIALLL
jgi:hypothetical protein